MEKSAYEPVLVFFFWWGGVLGVGEKKVCLGITEYEITISIQVEISRRQVDTYEFGFQKKDTV